MRAQHPPGVTPHITTEALPCPHPIRSFPHWILIRHSSFVIRHSLALPPPPTPQNTPKDPIFHFHFAPPQSFRAQRHAPFKIAKSPGMSPNVPFFISSSPPIPPPFAPAQNERQSGQPALLPLIPQPSSFILHPSACPSPSAHKKRPELAVTPVPEQPARPKGRRPTGYNRTSARPAVNFTNTAIAIFIAPQNPAPAANGSRLHIIAPSPSPAGGRAIAREVTIGMAFQWS